MGHDYSSQQGCSTEYLYWYLRLGYWYWYWTNGVLTTTLARSGVKIKVTGQCRRSYVCVLHEHPLRLPMNIDDGRSSRFPDFPTAMSSVASWRGEACGVAWPRPAAAAASSACGRGNAVGLTSIFDRRQLFQVLGLISGRTTPLNMHVILLACAICCAPFSG